MIASLLIDAGGICRKFIVEAVEQNALPAGHKALYVRTAEVEMPNLWVFQLVVPMTDAGEGSVHHNPFRDTLGIKRTWTLCDCRGQGTVNRMRRAAGGRNGDYRQWATLRVR